MRFIYALLLLLLLTGAVGGLWFWIGQKNIYTTPNSVVDFAETLKQAREVITPGPLRVASTLKLAQTPLTVAGVLAQTNQHRTQAGLKTLTGNSVLNKAAANKMADMFSRQYFAHESPTGEGPADVVEAVSYEYIRVGENLALGNFKDDADLVQAWMDSPGHRANILHAGMSELGIAVGRGQFEGRDTWLAVQTFALPLSSCPGIDADLQKTFDQKKTSFKNNAVAIEARRLEIDRDKAMLEALASEISDLTDQGNEKINEGNKVAQEQGNDAAQPYWTAGAALQAKANDKRAEFELKKSSFDQQVADFNKAIAEQNILNEELDKMVKKMNGQIKVFNLCLSG